MIKSIFLSSLIVTMAFFSVNSEAKEASKKNVKAEKSHAAESKKEGEQKMVKVAIDTSLGQIEVELNKIKHRLTRPCLHHRQLITLHHGIHVEGHLNRPHQRTPGEQNCKCY